MRKTSTVSWSTGFGSCASVEQDSLFHGIADQLCSSNSRMTAGTANCWDIAQAGSSHILRHFTIFTTTITSGQQEDCQKIFFFL